MITRQRSELGDYKNAEIEFENLTFIRRTATQKKKKEENGLKYVTQKYSRKLEVRKWDRPTRKYFKKQILQL